MRAPTHVAIATVLLCGCRTAAPYADLASLRQQVLDIERAFAKSMAGRDHASFTSFLADETIFFSCMVDREPSSARICTTDGCAPHNCGAARPLAATTPSPRDARHATL